MRTIMKPIAKKETRHHEEHHRDAVCCISKAATDVRAKERQSKASAEALLVVERICRTDGMRRMIATPTIKLALPMTNTAWIPRTDTTGPTTA